MRPQERNRRMDAIYARLPKIECRGLCDDQCTVIAYTMAERRRMEAASPDREAPRLRPARSTMECSKLVLGRCTIYEDRPLICRLYGVAEGLLCPHGCHPERLVTPAEIAELEGELRALGGVDKRSLEWALALATAHDAMAGLQRGR